MTERDLEREQMIVSLALEEFAANPWTTQATREYIKEHMTPNATRDWRENAPVPLDKDWEDYR